MFRQNVVVDRRAFSTSVFLPRYLRGHLANPLIQWHQMIRLQPPLQIRRGRATGCLYFLEILLHAFASSTVNSIVTGIAPGRRVLSLQREQSCFVLLSVAFLSQR